VDTTVELYIARLSVEIGQQCIALLNIPAFLMSSAETCSATVLSNAPAYVSTDLYTLFLLTSIVC
jgi:hypothetical protein